MEEMVSSAFFFWVEEMVSSAFFWVEKMASRASELKLAKCCLI